MTTEDNTARVEETAKQIDGDEHDQYHGDDYPSYGSRSESGLRASSNFRCDYKKIQNTSIFAQQMDTGHLKFGDVPQGYQLCYDKSDLILAFIFYEFQVIYFSYQSVF